MASVYAESFGGSLQPGRILIVDVLLFFVTLQDGFERAMLVYGVLRVHDVRRDIMYCPIRRSWPICNQGHIGYSKTSSTFSLFAAGSSGRCPVSFW